MATRTPLCTKVLDYYIREIESDFYKCTLCDPQKPISGKKKSNLLSHIRTCHSEILDDKQDKLAIESKRLRIIQSMAEIVTVNGRPFSYLLDSGFLRILREDLEQLDKAGHGITLNKNFVEIKEYVKHMTVEVQKTISQEAWNRFITLLLDIGSKNGQAILGIGIQFMIGDVVQNRTIGMIPLEKSHTATYIFEEVKKCLESYGININQVIAIVSDNASNMIAAAKRLDEQINAENGNDNTNEMNLPDFNHCGLDREQILSDITEMERLESILSDEENYEQLFIEVIGEITKHTTSVVTIRCGAHSVQLCVRAALKNSNLTSILSLSKYVVHKLHTQKYKYEIRDANIKCISPHTSNDTRWDSDLRMVCFHNNLLYNKPYSTLSIWFVDLFSVGRYISV